MKFFSREAAQKRDAKYGYLVNRITDVGVIVVLVVVGVVYLCGF